MDERWHWNKKNSRNSDLFFGGAGVGVFAFDAVFVEFVAEGPDADAQNLGGVGAVLTGAFQRGQDVVFLDFGQGNHFAAGSGRSGGRGGKGEGGRGGGGRATPTGEAEGFGLQQAGVAAENDGALDDVLQFAHVAGPVVGLERGHGGVGNAHDAHTVFAGKAG